MAESKDEKLIVELEERFWKSIADKQTNVALGLLNEPALMVSAKGAMKFDHAGYRKMAEDDAAYSLLDFKFSEMKAVFPTEEVAVLAYQVDQKAEMKGKKTDTKMSASSTWVKKGGRWVCVIHSESPMNA
ncbi:MAG: nuclear transport factor 2 family protein [Caldimonas sp.]